MATKKKMLTWADVYRMREKDKQPNPRCDFEDGELGATVDEMASLHARLDVLDTRIRNKGHVPPLEELQISVRMFNALSLHGITTEKMLELGFQGLCDHKTLNRTRTSIKGLCNDLLDNHNIRLPEGNHDG